MRMKHLIICLLIGLVSLLSSCASKQVVGPVLPPNKDETKDEIKHTHNFVFTAVNDFIDSPDKDGRVFYRIFINKEDYGRTTTGLESQRKIYETNLSENKHLLHVEKWILNNGEYVKANNILQPKPDFVYFDIVPNKATFVVLYVNNKGRYEFSVELSH